MAKQTKEVAVIDFEKFSVAQLPELQGKKEEIKRIREVNPVVEIVDNPTYELAKKSRTAVKTLRTSLKKEQRDVKKKIKEHVLDVVDAEYDTLVLGVKNQEIIRQEPITAWEDKKELERQEKARLEQERIDRIKTTISEFQEKWNRIIEESDFESISKNLRSYNNDTVNFDVESLQEFEVLYADACSQIERHFELRTKTLTEQEQIRLDNLLIQEKNAENARIQEWQRTWNANIDTLAFDDIKDVKSVLVKSKLADLKHYSNEYEEIYDSTEKRLNSQIELISKAENQRIAQEKFQKEKAEFEAKQLEAKYQERKKFLVDEDYWRIYLLAECAEEEDVAKSKLLDYSGEAFEDFKLAVLKAKESKEEIKTDEIAKGQEKEWKKGITEKNYIGDYHEEDVHEVATAKPHEFANYKDEVKYIEQVETKSEVTWESIYDDEFKNSKEYKDSPSNFLLGAFFNFLKDNYNAPTKKQ